MIIYSITISIEKGVEKNWSSWMKKKHIPDVLKTSMFSKFEFNKIASIHDTQLYEIKYTSLDFDKYLKYQRIFSKKLQKEHTNKFKNQFSAIRNLFISLD